MVINGMNGDPVLVNGQAAVFDMEFLLGSGLPAHDYYHYRHGSRPFPVASLPFFGSAIRVVTDLRTCMFAHSKELSQEYYQVNKVGNLMSLYTNDLDTVQGASATVF